MNDVKHDGDDEQLFALTGYGREPSFSFKLTLSLHRRETRLRMTQEKQLFSVVMAAGFHMAWVLRLGTHCGDGQHQKGAEKTKFEQCVHRFRFN